MKFILALLVVALSLPAFAAKFKGIDQEGNKCDLSIDLPLEAGVDGKYSVNVKVSADSKILPLESVLSRSRDGSLYLYSVMTLGMPMFSKLRYLTIYFTNEGTPTSYDYALATGGFNSKVVKQIKCQLQ